MPQQQGGPGKQHGGDSEGHWKAEAGGDCPSAPSSTLCKAATKLYKLVKKPKNAKLGKEVFLQVEEDTLKNYVGKVEEGVGEEEKEEENVKKRKCSVRKNYDELKDVRYKKARVTKVIETIQQDSGLGEDVLDHLKKLKDDPVDKCEKDEQFKIICLNLMKALPCFWKSRCFEDIKLLKQEKNLEIMTFSRDFVVSPVSFE